MYSGRAHAAHRVMTDLDPKDERKAEFALGALDFPDPFDRRVPVVPDIIEAERWKACRTGREIDEYGEKLVSACERAGEEMWETGICRDWFGDAHKDVRKVSVARHL